MEKGQKEVVTTSVLYYYYPFFTYPMSMSVSIIFSESYFKCIWDTEGFPGSQCPGCLWMYA